MGQGKVSAAACQPNTAWDEAPANPGTASLCLQTVPVTSFNFSCLKLHFCLLSEEKKFREATPVVLTVSEPDSYISAKSPVKPLEMYQINLCRAIILSTVLASYPL